ncbi:alpha/beta hydrolase [uncultured Bifidobacterium sp.]|uniref:alpha/beta hydrolase n=1 Tax=uncultured Bifidobacterium sp. TaxID=165187 RepID=UPI002596C535|nr:alpha/beta hydrolase [uncultured Bifidobacterium sp.]
MKRDNSGVVRNICIATGAATTLFAAGLALSADRLFRFALDTNNPKSIFHRASPQDADKERLLNTGEAREAGAWFSEAKQPVSITSFDGLNLHGWLFDPDCVNPLPHLYAICCHGYTGEPAEMAKWAHRFAKLGFTVLVPAQRAHELSEGRYVGMGWLERNDLLAWIHLIVESDPDARILLHGNSMGAATVMMAAGDPRLPRNVVSAIEDSGYASVRMQFIDSARSMFHLPKLLAAMCVDAAGLVCKYRAGFDFSDASCVEQLKHTTIPMLFIHGAADTFVSPRFLDMNYGACSSLDREKLLVPDADHVMSSAVAPDVYWSKVEGFVKRTFRI